MAKRVAPKIRSSIPTRRELLKLSPALLLGAFATPKLRDSLLDYGVAYSDWVSGATFRPGHLAQTFADADVVPLAPASVGFTPKGDARWGHADMAGNVWEWALDYYRLPKDDAATCRNCMNSVSAPERVARGGSYNAGPGVSQTTFRSSGDPTVARSQFGFRCARDVQ